ncbi:MAG: YceI family protein [Pseudomonadales bacterium]|nr:YceI family protein [Pseudomonadales bacterium]
MIRWIILSLFLPSVAIAEWRLDPDNSSVSFVSVKNAQVAEAHAFTSLEGTVTDQGVATVRITLDSVETMVPIRNERMREMLFETGVFPNATFESRVPLDSITGLAAGETARIDLDGTLSVHGNSATLSIPVIVTNTGNGSYQVNTVKPVIVSAEKFDLVAGIEKLREVAGLDSIAPSVPVSFSLQFDSAK